MPSHIDPDTLDKMILTIQSFVPSVRSGIENYLRDISNYQELENAYGNVHPIRDVAGMLAFPIVSHLSILISEMMEHIAAAPNEISPGKGTYLLEVVNLIEPYLESLKSGDGQDADLAATAVVYYRRFMQLPEHDDQIAIQELLLGSSASNADHDSVLENQSDGIGEPTWENDNDFDMQMDFSAELLEGFLIEAEDYLDTIGSLLPAVSEQTEQNDQLQQIRRSVHTLKGAAGVVGLMDVSQLAHRMEDVLDDLYDGQLALTPRIKEVMLSTFDVLEDYIRDKRAQGEIDPASQQLYSAYDEIMGAGSTVPQQEIENDELVSTNTMVALAQADYSASDEVESDVVTNQNEVVKAGGQQGELIRVPTERLDEMVRLVGELVISRSVFEQHLGSLMRQVDELYLSIERLQRTSTNIETQYEVSALIGSQSPAKSVSGGGLSRAGSEWTGIVEFDELEFDRYSDFHLMSRDLTETCADIGAISTEFREIVGEFDAYLTRQSRLTSEVQDKLMHFRMVPLASLSTRLQRAVRVTARQRGKIVNLTLEGEDVQFDKTMLDELNEALLHILRNAVDHGIEAPSIREGIGKSNEGLIQLKAFREGTQIVVQIKDDGAGLNPQRIRAKAIQNGLVLESEVESWPNEQLFSLIFAPGFSTAQEVSEVSGRGVGMDIVQETVSRLKGRISIDSILSEGTTITIRLPLTLAVTQVLMVHVSTQVFAIPLADVMQVINVEEDSIEKVSNTKVINIGGKVLPVVVLAESLSLQQNQSSTEERIPVIVVEAGGQQIALVVDQLLGGREVVVKTLGSHLRRVHGLIGSTIMGDGSIILILNPSELIRGSKIESRKTFTPKISKSTRTSETFDILVVDDSFSVRRVVANLVKSAGWN